MSVPEIVYWQLRAADSLAHAVRYIAQQFRMDFTRDEAQANVDTRKILLNCEWRVIDGAEVNYGKPPRSAA